MQILALLVALAIPQSPTLDDRLIDAVRQKDLTKASRLLDEGAKADAIDHFGWCALTLVPPDVSTAFVVKLLDKGADPNRIAMHGDPAIVRFANFNRFDLVKLLVERGAKVDADAYFGQTALGETARQGRLDIMKYLIEHKADPKHLGWSKQTAFHFAVQRTDDNSEVLNYLLKLGLDVNARSEVGMTPLHSVAYLGGAANAKWLLAHGANPKLKDQQGKTALQIAIDYQKATKTDRRAVIAVLSATK